MSSISFDIFDNEKIPEHVVVGASVYSSPEVIGVEHLRWKHLENPYGPSTSVSLRDKLKVLVGRSFIQPRTFWVSPFASCHGATITDLVIMPEERSAAALIDMTRAIKSPEGVNIVIHTSNDVSNVIYQKLFKFPVAFTLNAVGLPIRISNILKSIFDNAILIRVAELLISPWRWGLRASASVMGVLSDLRLAGEPTDSTMSEIFEEHRQHVGPHFERSQRYLKWRFAEGPIFNGKIEWIWSQNQCLGYLAFKQVSLDGLDVFVVLDAVLRRRLSLREAIALKLVATRLAIDNSCDAIFILANLENHALTWLKGFPFFHISDRHLPHPTPIFIHATKEYKFLENQEDLFFTLADLDYF